MMIVSPLNNRARMALAAAFIIAAGIPACSGHDEKKAPPAQAKKIITVKVMEVQPETFQQSLTLSASAKAFKEVAVASEAMGRVEKTAFEKGSFVKEGEPLLWLDASTMKAQRGQAIADRDMAQLDYEKQKTLKERGGSVSDYALERARLILDSANARVRGIETSLAKYVINAPISGVAVGKEVEVGAVAAPGAPITRIVSVDPIKVSAGIPETAMGDFAHGKKASVVIDAYPGRTWEGKITYISPEVNKAARVVDIEVTLPNADRAIRPEMAAKIVLARKSIPNSILIPQSSILELVGGHAVFVVDQGGAARQKMVEIIDFSAGKALIKSGLAAGDRLVTLGQRDLIDGDTVRIEE